MIDKEFELKNILQKDLYGVTNFEEFFKTPSIVLASSGMVLERTASYNLAQYWIKKYRSAIFTVGYMEENTPGYKLANGEMGDKIKLSENSEPDILKCTIKRFRFPSHALREELIEIVKMLKPKKVILVHGAPSAIDWIGENIIKINKQVMVYSVEPGRELLL
jgi:predicted metal-dependent RNase